MHVLLIVFNSLLQQEFYDKNITPQHCQYSIWNPLLEGEGRSALEKVLKEEMLRNKTWELYQTALSKSVTEEKAASKVNIAKAAVRKTRLPLPLNAKAPSPAVMRLKQQQCSLQAMGTPPTTSVSLSARMAPPISASLSAIAPIGVTMGRAVVPTISTMKANAPKGNPVVIDLTVESVQAMIREAVTKMLSSNTSTNKVRRRDDTNEDNKVGSVTKKRKIGKY